MEKPMEHEFIVRQQELVENPTARVPICLVLDVSGSMATGAAMGGSPIEELQEGVQMFFDAIRQDEVAQHAAEICIVTFGGEVRKELDFLAIGRQVVPTLSAAGGTPMGEAVERALDLLEARKAEYRNAGVDYFQPWMVVMTDGQPTDDIGLAASRIRDLVNSKKLSVFPIAIGEGADIAQLSRLSPTRPPLKLQGLNFKEFFLWLSRSVSRVSQSTPGEAVTLDTDGIKAWGQV
jgi:uncharacterized protein YegL